MNKKLEKLKKFAQNHAEELLVIGVLIATHAIAYKFGEGDAKDAWQIKDIDTKLEHWTASENDRIRINLNNGKSTTFQLRPEVFGKS